MYVEVVYVWELRWTDLLFLNCVLAALKKLLEQDYYLSRGCVSKTSRSKLTAGIVHCLPLSVGAKNT